MDMTSPPENENDQVAAVQPGEGAEPAPAKVKLKTDVTFLILGILTPIVLVGGLSALSALAQPLGFLGGIAFVLAVPLFIMFLVLFLVGRQKGDVRMRSYGKGGLWAYVTVPLAILVAFGTCIVGGFPA